MTWTYNEPTGTPLAWPTVKDHVRFLLGDRVQSSWSLSDAEVEQAVAAWNARFPDHADNAFCVAASIALALADWADVDGLTSESKTVGNSSLSRSYSSSRAGGWKRLAMRLAGLCPVAVPGATMVGFGLAAEGATPERVFTLKQFDNGGITPGVDRFIEGR